MYEVLSEKNGYMLVQLENNQYSFGSDDYFKREHETFLKGSKKDILNSLKYCIRHCEKKIIKYEEKNYSTIVELSKQQKEALLLFVKVLEDL